MDIFTANALSVRYGHHQALQSVSLSIAAGQHTVLIGPSGGGKSTLLRIAMGLARPDSGTLAVGGECVWGMGGSDQERRRVLLQVGMIFQHFNLFPHLTVLGNCTLALRTVLQLSAEESIDRAQEVLKRVGLEDKATSWPATLSGGQRQRVAIARALALRPRLLLCDEPTSALDPELVGEVVKVLRELSEAGDTTLMVATHHMGFARDIARQAVFLEHGQIRLCGSPQQVFVNSEDDRVRNFLTSQTA